LKTNIPQSVELDYLQIDTTLCSKHDFAHVFQQKAYWAWLPSKNRVQSQLNICIVNKKKIDVTKKILPFASHAK
jgi:hypothetical protein